MDDDWKALEARIRRSLAQVADILDLRLLTADERARVRELETSAEAGGAAGGVVPFVNQGVTGALACDRVLAALTGPMRRDPPQPWTVYLDDEDQLIGEWLPADRLAEARKSGRCVFLSDDFVLYKDRKSVGRGRFVMPFIELTAEQGGEDLVVGIGCPSGPADVYLRSLMGEPGAEVATLLVGICHRQPDESKPDQDQGEER
jgi:hypothetical protein